MNSKKSRPDWRDDSVGTRDRVALWLVDEVGVGKHFTSAQLREAIPGVAQVDRRMRDLREHGWRINIARQDPTLKLHELRFVAQGSAVWEHRVQVQPKLTARERDLVLQRDRFACVLCGIPGGEVHPEAPLRRAHVAATREGDTAEYVTKCDMCRAAGGTSLEWGTIERLVADLSVTDRASLRAWLAADERPRSAAERLWIALRRTTPSQRQRVLDLLRPATQDQVLKEAPSKGRP